MECPEAGMVQTCPTLRQGKEDFVYHTDQSDTQKAYGPVRCLLPILNPQGVNTSIQKERT